MLVKDIESLYKTASKNTTYSLASYKEVIDSQFEYGRKFVDNPTHGALELPGFGVIYVDKASLQTLLRRKIAMFRRKKRPKHADGWQGFERFRTIGKYRHIVYEYYNSKQKHRNPKSQQLQNTRTEGSADTAASI